MKEDKLVVLFSLFIETTFFMSLSVVIYLMLHTKGLMWWVCSNEVLIALILIASICLFVRHYGKKRQIRYGVIAGFCVGYVLLVGCHMYNLAIERPIEDIIRDFEIFTVISGFCTLVSAIVRKFAAHR